MRDKRSIRNSSADVMASTLRFGTILTPDPNASLRPAAGSADAASQGQGSHRGFLLGMANASRRGLVWIGLVAALAVGCGSPSRRPTAAPSVGSKSRADGLHLFGVPTALNLDGVPGPDGFAVRVFYSLGTRARGIPISNGTLEILMFDGALGDGFIGGTAAAPAAPLRVWPFTAPALKEFSTSTSLGIGYQLVLRWGQNRPTKEHFTVVARYRPPNGPVLLSTPSSISTGVD